MIGKIDIKRKFSFFEIEKSNQDKLINALNKRNFNGTELLLEIAQEKPEIISQNKSNSYGKKNKKKRFKPDRNYNSKSKRKFK